MTKKKVVKKNKIKDNILNEAQLREIDNAHCQQQICEVKLKCEKIILDKLRSEIELIDAKFKLKKNELKEQSLKISDHEKDLIKAKEVGKKLTNRIKEEYGLKDKWGYDPITGEIKDD
jgi:chromatin remodeling complex protein RSC6